MNKHVDGFTSFIREQGVVGLAIGFILGGSVSKVVSSLVNDVINPVLGVALGVTGDLSKASIAIGGTHIMWGKFVNVLIDFLVISLVVYFGVKFLRLIKLKKSQIQTPPLSH